MLGRMAQERRSELTRIVSPLNYLLRSWRNILTAVGGWMYVRTGKVIEGLRFGCPWDGAGIEV